ncbi:efflux RND transporter periplasmic adaptor subunit [Tritonibacter mobilis]|nr:efflux RND transporter periplasmic adaptor subunit [Tritonibacter mobilis]
MSASEDLETRLRSLSIDRTSPRGGTAAAKAAETRASDVSQNAGQGPAPLRSVTPPLVPKPRRRLGRRLGGAGLVLLSTTLVLGLSLGERAPGFAQPAITEASRLWAAARLRVEAAISGETPAFAPVSEVATAQGAASSDTSALARAGDSVEAAPGAISGEVSGEVSGDASGGIANVAPTGPRVIGSGFVVAPTSVVLMSDIGGQVARVDVEVGTRLKTGDPVLHLDQSDAKLAVGLAHESYRLAKAQLRSARADFAAAEGPLQRLETLEARGVGKRAELEDARLDLAVRANAIAIAQSQVETARLTLERAERDLDKHILRAPFDAVVVALPAAPGMMVASGTSGGADEAGLMELMDISHLYVDVDVAERNIAAIGLDQGAEVRLDAFPERSFAAQVTMIDPRASREKATIRVRLRLEADDLIGVRPNMSAKATFINRTDRALAQLRLNGSN